MDFSGQIPTLHHRCDGHEGDEEVPLPHQAGGPVPVCPPRPLIGFGAHRTGKRLNFQCITVHYWHVLLSRQNIWLLHGPKAVVSQLGVPLHGLGVDLAPCQVDPPSQQEDQRLWHRWQPPEVMWVSSPFVFSLLDVMRAVRRLLLTSCHSWVNNVWYHLPLRKA